MSVRYGLSTSIIESRRILYTTKTAYPAIVLTLFLVLFLVYGILTAPGDERGVKIEAKRGPGGRPLPLRRISAKQSKEAVKVKDFSPAAKLTFRLVAAGVLCTFVANATVLILQTLIYRRQEWWPGQSAVVSPKLINWST